MLSASDYGQGSVTVVNDRDELTVKLMVSGAVEYTVDFPYGDDDSHRYFDDARDAAKREAEMKANGAVRALREANEQGQLGEN